MSDELRTAARELLTALAPLPVASAGAAGAAFDRLDKSLAAPVEPIPMRLTCPDCGELHVDEGKFATKPHHTHACQACGAVWRPAVVPTVGVRFLPGFKNEQKCGDVYGGSGPCTKPPGHDGNHHDGETFWTRSLPPGAHP